MGFEEKIQIYFYLIKTKSFDWLKKFRSVFIFEKKKNYEEDLIHKIISCYMTQTIKQQFMISFFISKICICFNKNQICILRKIQISFDVRKI